MSFARRVLLMNLMLILLASLAMSQSTILSTGGGGSWTSTATWQGGVVPGALDSVVVTSGDSVYFSELLNYSCKSLTVASGGKLATIASTDSILTVTDVFTLEANATYFNGSSSSTVPGDVRVLDNASLVVHRGVESVGGPSNLEFGNLTIQRSAGSTCGGDLIIHGDLTIDNAAGQTFRAITRTQAGSRTCTVDGNVYHNQGQWSCVDYGSDSTIGATWNIYGNVYLLGPNSRMMTFTSAYAQGIAVFNIHGDLIINDGRLSAGSSSSRGYGTGIINLYKNFTMTGGYTTTNHKGPFSINFVGTDTQWVKLDTNFSINQEPVFDTIATGATVVFDLGNHYWSSGDTVGGTAGGAFVVNGTLILKDSSQLEGDPTFTVSPGAKLGIGSVEGMWQLPDTTHGNIQVNRTRTYSPDATYEYLAAGAQETGDALPATVDNVIINNANGVTLTAPVTIAQSLTVADGDLLADGNMLTLGPTATMSESPGNTVVGTVQTTRTVAASSTEDFGGMGATITASATAPGATTVTRVTDVPQTGLGYESIYRAFDISPAVNSGLNATLEFVYDASELNGQSASTMKLWKSTDAGSSWVWQPATNNAAQHKLTATGVSSFSRWTGADALHPIGVTLGTINIPVLERWNMISNPVNAPDNSVSTLFPSASSSAFKFVPGIGYQTTTTVPPGTGYWLKFPAPETVPVYGAFVEVDTVDVQGGWNLIGSIAYPIPVENVVPLGTSVTSVFYRYNQGYVRADSIKPGEAYWVKVDQNGQLILSGGPVAK